MNQIETTIISTLKKLMQNDNALWSIEDVARYLNMNHRTLQNHIAKKKDFPLSIRIPYGEGSKTQARWVPEEIKKWALRHRHKN